MQDADSEVRHKAVVAARELLAAPEKLVQCIAAGITRALTQLLQVRCRHGLSAGPRLCHAHMR